MKECPKCKKVLIIDEWTQCTHCAELAGDREASSKSMK